MPKRKLRTLRQRSKFAHIRRTRENKTPELTRYQVMKQWQESGYSVEDISRAFEQVARSFKKAAEILAEHWNIINENREEKN